MSDCVGKQSRNPSPIADNRNDCPIDSYNESCNNTQSSQAERGMGYNPPEKNEQPAASPVLRSDFNLHETRNGLPRAVGDSMMSPIAQFPQDPRVLMENYSIVFFAKDAYIWCQMAHRSQARTTYIRGRLDEHAKRRDGSKPRLWRGK